MDPIITKMDAPDGTSNVEGKVGAMPKALVVINVLGTSNVIPIIWAPELGGDVSTHI